MTGVAVDPVNVLAHRGEKMAEELVAAHLRGGGQDGHGLCAADLCADLDCLADGADFGCGIERSADFILQEFGAQRRELCEGLWQLALHPSGEGAGGGGNADPRAGL